MSDIDETNPAVVVEDVTFTYPETDTPVFTGLNLELPPGRISFVGQNGTGKSTLLLLAGGRIFPQTGQVTVLNKKTTDIESEEERNRYVSFVYQNMEFETEEPIGELMMFVYENGFHTDQDAAFIRELTDAFELGDSLGKQLQTLSKGEMQRAIMAFSLLYGSKMLMMDEPIFALEAYQKERAMKLINEYSKQHNVSVYYSVHELEISRTYSDMALLFYKDGRIRLGPTDEMLADSVLEEAYEFPPAMLYKKEAMFREGLKKIADLKRGSV